DASLEDGVLTLSNIRTTGESGTTQGFLSTDLSRILSFDITFALLNANINRFFDAISEEQDWIRGNMDLNGRLYGENGSVNGTLNLVAKNGRLKKYALFSRIFALLNIYKIVQARDIELTSRNFPYNVITSTFHIEDSVMRFDDFFLDSNSLQLSAAGKYSFKSREIDAVLGIQPFETIDRAISWIPLLGWVLTGDNGRLLVVSLKVAGQIDDPTVQIAPIETISAPIRESWSRTLNLPAEIRNEWRKYMPKKK
ncbi:MAG TPA: AsmA-like C-terminal domain-containing protein, partial [Deltaproteobacteria bacterium]|nr:AsmA-like C-terminal domain-containing protein [Deltaproteobacteria bacterium]